MSEPSQLFVRAHISSDAFAEFLQQSSGPASEFHDFPGWLASKEWHGDISAEQIIASAMDVRIEDWRAGFTADPAPNNPPPLRDHYDAENEIWTLVVFDFGENFGSFIATLNVLRQLARYAKTAPTSYAAIVPLWFGPGFKEPDAVLEIHAGQARLIPAAPGEFATWAEQELKAIVDEYAARYDD